MIRVLLGLIAGATWLRIRHPAPFEELRMTSREVMRDQGEMRHVDDKASISGWGHAG